MVTTDRSTIPVPVGRRVYVVSDLSLSPTVNPARRPVRELTALLGDLDEPALVVVAGNLFAATDDDPETVVRATLRALPTLVGALRSYLALPEHRLIVLPGHDDPWLAEDAPAAPLLELGVEIAPELMLQVATHDSVRDVAVVAGCPPQVAADLAERERVDARLLEDPDAVARLAASRMLYRRLGGWVWFPVIAVVLADLSSLFLALANRLTRHHLRIDLDVHIHHRSGGLLLALVTTIVVVGLIEAGIAALAGLIVRRRFERGAAGAPPRPLDPLAAVTVDGVDALEFARRIVGRGGAGAIVGGATAPALVFLDRGFCAAPGPARATVVERHGRFGLPPVFAPADRWSVVQLDAGGAVHVRMAVGQSRARYGTWLERLVAGDPTQVDAPSATTEVGAWPVGDPYPIASDGLAAQRRERTVRRVISGLVLLDGLIDVTVTALPPLRSRLHAVEAFLSLGAAQSAAALTAVAGIVLIMVARGLRRGQRRSWTVAVVLTGATTLAHLARAGSLVSPVLAVSLLSALLIERRHFRATTDRESLRRALPRLGLVAVLTVVGATIGIELTAHRSVPGLSTVLLATIERLIGITSVSLPDRVGDFATPTLGAVGLGLIVVALYLVTRPVVDRRLSRASGRERRLAELRAREIVRRHGRGTLDYFALRDDKQLFFFRDSLVAYAVYGGVALISPDPIGPTAERTEVFRAFRAYVDSRAWTVAVMGAGSDWLPVYHAAGLHSIYLGDEAIVDCQHFSLEGHKMKGLRQATTRLTRKGYTVEFLDPATIDPLRVPALVDLIAMLRRGEGERGFSMMLGRLFDPRDQGLLLTVVSDPTGRPAALCQFVPSPAIAGYSLDLMRRDPGEHPNGLIDFALCSTIAYLRERGGRGLSLNFAAFRSVLEGERGEGTFTRIERWGLRRLSGILPIETLWSFNAKYQPSWLPRYLIYPAAESFVPVVSAILRAESITELPLIGRFFSTDPVNRPGTVVPESVLAAARERSR